MPGIALAAGVAAAEALDCQIAWPNDLMFVGRKVGGVLCQVEIDLPPLVGIGANFHVAPAVVGAGFLPGSRDTALERLLAALALLKPPAHFRDIEQRWRARDSTPGKRYLLPSGAEAVALRVDAEGSLVADAEGKQMVVLSATALYGSGS